MRYSNPPPHRRVALSLLAPTLLVLAGCSSTTLREGVWTLSFQAQRTQNRLPFPIDEREVVLDAGFDGGKEVVELAPVDEDLPAVYGDIVEEGDSKVIRLEHIDEDWHWRMFGVVHSEEAVFGRYFMAKSRQFEDLTIDGRWAMRWKREADE